MEKISWQIKRKNSPKDIPFVVLNGLILIVIAFNAYNKSWYSVAAFALMAIGYSITYLQPKKTKVVLEKDGFNLNGKNYLFADFKKFHFFIDRNMPFFILVPNKVSQSSIEIELPQNENKIKSIRKFLADVGLVEEEKKERFLSELSRYFRQ